MNISMQTVHEIYPDLEILNYDPSVSFNQFCHDSRNVNKGELFVPVIGENFDGHDYIKDAVEKDCIATLCQRDRLEKVEGLSVPIIVHDDWEVLLSKVVSVIRKEIDAKVIGITGSVGKSTTRNLVASVLRESGDVLVTDSSNTLWGNARLLMDYDCEDYVVLEMGIDGKDEMIKHAEGVIPNIGAILNIGSVHASKVGSADAIFETKRQLADFCVENDGKVILNIDDERLKGLAEEIPDDLLITVGCEDADYSFMDLSVSEEGTSFKVNGEDYELSIFGKEYVYNAMVAIAVGFELGLGLEQIKEGLKKAKPVKGRFEIIKKGDLTIVNDAYNANPQSMRLSLETFNELYGEDGRKILFLGEMRELGSVAEDEHRKLGLLLKEYDFDGAYYLGSYADLVGVNTLKDLNEAKELLKDIKEGYVLLKGSNGVGLWKLVE